jgi:hypothetical protein
MAHVEDAMCHLLERIAHFSAFVQTVYVPECAISLGCSCVSQLNGTMPKPSISNNHILNSLVFTESHKI